MNNHTEWASLPRLCTNASDGVAVWTDEPEARQILAVLAARLPREERDTRRYVLSADESIRYVGALPARLEAIRGEYLEAAMARCDSAAYWAQRPVAWVIMDVLDQRVSMADVREVRAGLVAA